jgi:hypothetical protein
VLAADRVLSEAAMVTVIDDREGDIYKKFVTPRAAHVRLLGRADHNRVMSDGAKLFDTMAALPNVAGRQIQIPAKGGQPARTAQTQSLTAWDPRDRHSENEALRDGRAPRARLHLSERAFARVRLFHGFSLDFSTNKTIVYT